MIELAPKDRADRAPPWTTAEWLNAAPLELADLRGRVVFGRPEDLHVGAAVQALVSESARPRPASGCDDDGCLIGVNDASERR